MASTFSLLVSYARLPVPKPEERKYCGSSRHSFALAHGLEPKVPDCTGILVYCFMRVVTLVSIMLLRVLVHEADL